jgi:hypothetical protein
MVIFHLLRFSARTAVPPEMFLAPARESDRVSEHRIFAFFARSGAKSSNEKSCPQKTGQEVSAAASPVQRSGTV